uniref:Desmoplakin a n=1 Tax=Oncorhynchus tshawytscha TaxID=74940 RepID=A0A8C8KA13_ONCTS
ISMYGSQSRLPTMIRRTNSRPDLTSGSFTIPRNDGSQVFVGGNGYQQEYGDGYTYSQTYSKSSLGGGGGGVLGCVCVYYCTDHMIVLPQRGPAVEVDKLMTMSSETIDQLNEFAIELQQMRQPNDIIIRRQGQLSVVVRENRALSPVYLSVCLQRLIETSPWGDDAATIEQQILSQNKLHSSIQRSHEVDHARDELAQKDDKGGLHSLQQEWDSLQKMSFARTGQLRELQNIIEEISRAIMWVNEREEEELVFNWGDKNIDVYIPKKQESYSKLMSALEEKEKELNKLKQKVDGLLKNNHPASDKIEAYMDTLQTQWSWLLQITKCIHVHLKENAAYSQFFKEANETYSKLQKDHEIIRKKFTCDKGTPLENLTELLKNLEREKERVMENKRPVKHLVNKSKSIVRLRPRNPEEKSSTAVIVQALCDFKQDQKGILKGDEGILKDNSQRSKWQVTGPGGLDMLIPSVCLLIPPPNPLSIGLANKNEQYYEAIMGIWNQLYINIKSLISWQYCVKDINHINSLTLTMLSQMRPEEYRNIIKSLETHYQEFLRNSHGSEMFGEDEKKKMESQYSGAQSHYDTLVIGLPTYSESKGIMLDPEPPIKANTTKITHTSLKETSISTQGSNMSLTLLSDLQALRRRLELAESGLSHHLHVSLGENSVQECSQHLLKLEGIHNDLDGVRDEYLRLRERVVKQLEGTAADSEQAKFLRKELDLLNQKLGDLQGLSSAYLQRLSYLQNLLQSLIQAEDVIKVHEARLTEKETTSLDLNELERYRATLKQMKSDLEHKRDLLTAMESDLANAVHVNSQISASLHKCDVDLSKYSELVTQMSDRWRRIQTQIDSRVWDLEKQEKQLRHFQQSSGVVDQWIDNARQRQDTLQTAKFSNIQAVMEHLDQQKVLHSEIKGKKEKVEDVQKDADTCAASIKDYELQLASYSAGLETLLNIPIKRTMLQSPATVVRQEGADLQSRYIELLTRSSDYYKFLGEMLKNMEELKIRNTKIEMLEEELRRLKEDIGGHSQKNRSLEDALSRYKLELSQSKEQLISMEEVKRTTAVQVSVARESLDNTSSQLTELNDKLARLTYQLDEEKRKKRLAEERYTSQQEEYEAAMRRRQKELDELNWSKIDLEKAVKDKERELERLRMQLEEEATRRRGAEQEISKVRTQCNQEMSNLKQTFESEIHVTKTTILKASQQKQEDTAELKLQCEGLESDKRDLEEELRRLRLSVTQTEAMRRKAEDEAHQQRSTGTEESRRRRELEIQLQTVATQRGEEELRQKEALAEATRSSKEKSRQIILLTHNLEEEGKKRSALEIELTKLRQSYTELQTSNATSREVINKLKISEQDIHLVRVELEKQTNERTKAETTATRLQSRIRDLQAMVDGLEADMEKQKRTTQDEFTRRKRIESELEKMTQSCREHTTTLNTFRARQEEVSTSGRKYEQELRALQEALDKSLREHKATTEHLALASAELKALQQQLFQEQGKVREVNLRNESLYKTIEEKSRLLNDATTEIEKLQSLTQNLTKERLRLEEELRGVKQEKEQLKLNRDSVDGESQAQISSLHVQLQSSSKMTLELQALIKDLTKEREKLKSDLDKVQKQSIETSMIVQKSQTHYTEILSDRDALLIKLKQLEQDKSHQGHYKEELNRIKVSLETELRNKQRLQEERDKMQKDFTYWKSQYELKETQMRQSDSDKGKMERERLSLKSELERMIVELRTVEERYKGRLQSSEREVSDLALKRDTLEKELRRRQQRPDSMSIQTQTDEKVVTPMTVQGLRGEVSVTELINSNLLSETDVQKLNQGKLSSKDIEDKLKNYLHGSNCIAGIYDEANNRAMTFYQAMKDGLLRQGTTLELLEAQAASGFMIDPVNNVCLTVDEAWKRGLVGKEFKDKLMSAERAVTGYKDPHTGKTISLFQAIEKDLIEKGHGIRLLEAQIASGGIIDPKESHRIDVDIAYKRGYFDEEMNEILSYEGDDTKGFFDPNTQENLTYLQLKERCITDPKTGLVLLPLRDKTKPQQTVQQSSQNTILRKRRVVIVDPDTGIEMTVREAYHKELIDYDTFLSLSEQECEWEEITITASDGSARLVVVDRKTGTQYDIQDSLDRGIIDQTSLEQYRSGTLTLPQFADLITSNSNLSELTMTARNMEDVATCSSPPQARPSSPTVRKRFNNISIIFSPPEEFDEGSPVAAIFDTETMEKITIPEALRRGLVDAITAQRLLEAQACTGGIINPTNGQRLNLQDAVHQSIIDNDMATKLKPAQKAFMGFEDMKTKRKMSAAEAMKEKWLPYEAGQRFLEFQYLTGGLLEPGTGQQTSIEEAIRRGWLDGRGAQKLQDTRSHAKNLTCPKTKLKISYKEAMDSCMVEEGKGMKMLQASSISTKGISSPYNVSNPGSRSGSRTGSRTGSRSGSRRGSVDYSSSYKKRVWS